MRDRPEVAGAPAAGDGWTGRAAVAGLLAAVLLAHLLTLRAGQPWNDDFAMYLLHARNLVEGRPYAETGFIYNPADPHYSPRVYPPGFALILAPFYALAGFDMLVLRIPVILSAVAAVAAFMVVARPLLPPRLVLAGAALFGLQPYLLRFKNLLVPDFTFMLVALLALHLLKGLGRAGGGDGDNDAGDGSGDAPSDAPGDASGDAPADLASSHARVRGVLAGVAVYAAVSLRTAGVALIAAPVLYWLIRRRRPPAPVLFAGATAGLLYLVQVAAMPPGSGYAAQYAEVQAIREQNGSGAGAATDAGAPGAYAPPDDPLVVRVATRVRDIVLASDVLWAAEGELYAPPFAGVEKWFVALLMLATGGLALAGFALRARRPSVLEVFVVSYAGLLMLWWGTPDGRYLIPLYPFLFLYMLIGARALHARGGAVVRAVVVVAGVMVGASYVANLARMDRTPFSRSVTEPEARELFAWVAQCTPEDARLLAVWPRAMALFTDREATRMLPALLEAEADGAAVLVETVVAMEVDHVVAFNESDLGRFAAGRADFEQVFGNGRYRVFRYLPAGGAMSAGACGPGGASLRASVVPPVPGSPERVGGAGPGAGAGGGALDVEEEDAPVGAEAAAGELGGPGPAGFRRWLEYEVVERAIPTQRADVLFAAAILADHDVAGGSQADVVGGIEDVAAG